MILKIVLGLAFVIAAIVLIAAFRPAHFRVERSIAISAPPAVVFAHVNTLKAWDAWSPWVKLDPEMKETHEGPAAGPGAVCVFSGPKSGAGRSTIVESHPGESIRMKLEMTKPFAATNDVQFTFKPQGDQTVVTWAMSGTSNLMMRIVGLFMNCEKMVGSEFEKGLSSLRQVAESDRGPALQTARR